MITNNILTPSNPKNKPINTNSLLYTFTYISTNLQSRNIIQINYIIHFWMNQENRLSDSQQLSQDLERHSNNSDDFQQLNTCENQSTYKSSLLAQQIIYFEGTGDDGVGMKIDLNLQNKETRIQTLAQKQIKQQLILLRKIKYEYEQKVQKLTKQNTQLTQNYNISITQLQVQKSLNEQLLLQKTQLTDKILEQQQHIENIQQQSQEYLQKINCLQKKIQFQKQDFDCKLDTIRKFLQKFSKSSVKCMDNQNTFKLLVSKLGEIQKVIERICQIQDMIIDKTQKNKMVNSNNNNISANTVKCGEVNDFIQQKIKGLEKIENVLVKQQNKINALKDQTIKLEQQLKYIERGQRGNGINLGKWLDPVIKFCKIQEGGRQRQKLRQKQSERERDKQKQTKKRKENI